MILNPLLVNNQLRGLPWTALAIKQSEHWPREIAPVHTAFTRSITQPATSLIDYDICAACAVSRRLPCDRDDRRVPCTGEECCGRCLAAHYVRHVNAELAAVPAVAVPDVETQTLTLAQFWWLTTRTAQQYVWQVRAKRDLELPRPPHSIEMRLTTVEQLSGRWTLCEASHDVPQLSGAQHYTERACPFSVWAKATLAAPTLDPQVEKAILERTTAFVGTIVEFGMCAVDAERLVFGAGGK